MNRFLWLIFLLPVSVVSAQAIPLKTLPPRSSPLTPAPAAPAPKPALKEAPFSLEKAVNLREVLALIGPLSLAEIEFLEKNRFLLRPKPARPAPRPDSEPVYDEMLAAFDSLGGPLSENLRRPEHARFIGPDIFIHALSRYLAIRQSAAETGPMRDLLRRLLTGLYENAAVLRAGFAGTGFAGTAFAGNAAADWERLTAQLLAPLIIIDLPAEPTDADDEPAAALARLKARSPRLTEATLNKLKTELQRIYRAQETKPGLLGLTPADLSPAIDYSVFKPEGRYAASPASRSFFRAAVWLSRLGWDVRNEESLADAVNLALALSYEPAPTPAADQSAADRPDPGPLAALARLLELADFFYGCSWAPGWDEWMPFLMKEAEVPEFTAASAAQAEVRRPLMAAAASLTVSRRQFSELRPAAAAPVLTLWPRRLDFPRMLAEELTGRLSARSVRFSSSWLPALWEQRQATLAVASQTDSFYVAGGTVADEPGERPAEALIRLARSLKDRPEEDWFSSLGSAWWRVWTTLNGDYGSGYPLYMRSRAFAAKELETILGGLTELPFPLAAAAPLTRTFPAQAEPKTEPPPNQPAAGQVKGFVEPNPDFWRQMNRLVKFIMAGFQHYDLFPEDMENSGALSRFLRRLERVIDLAGKELSGEDLTEDDYEFIRLFTLDWMAAPLGAPRERPWPESEIGAVGGGAFPAAGQDSAALYEALAESWLMLVLAGNEETPRLTLGLAYNHYEFLSPLPRLKVAELWLRAVYRSARLNEGAESGLPPKNFWYEPLWPAQGERVPEAGAPKN